jgi:hypothetical protein
MSHRALPVLSAAFILSLSWSAYGQETKTPIVGTWQVTSFTMLTLGTNEISRPFGESPKGYLQYSPGKHMVVFLQAGSPKQPANAAYTDTDRAEIHRSIFGAYAGTYTVEGGKVVHHVIASWRPEWIGGDQVRYFEITGNKLTIKTAPVKSTRTGEDIVATLTFERVE